MEKCRPGQINSGVLKIKYIQTDKPKLFMTIGLFFIYSQIFADYSFFYCAFLKDNKFQNFCRLKFCRVGCNKKCGFGRFIRVDS